MVLVSVLPCSSILGSAFIPDFKSSLFPFLHIVLQCANNMQLSYFKIQQYRKLEKLI